MELLEWVCYVSEDSVGKGDSCLGVTLFSFSRSPRHGMIDIDFSIGVFLSLVMSRIDQPRRIDFLLILSSLPEWLIGLMNGDTWLDSCSAGWVMTAA